MKTRKTVAVAATLAATVILAGCGSSSTPSSGGGPTTAGAAGATTKLTVGMGQRVFTAPMTTDAFSAAGLDVTQQTLNSGAAGVPLLLNGQLQFIEADAVGVLTAISKNIPLVIVGVVTSSATTPAADNTGVFVKPDSPIQSAADLSGKKVAVNAVGGGAQLSAAASIDKLGGDSSKVNFVELPPATIIPYVLNGTVDAGVTTEPVVGVKAIIRPLATGTPGAPQIVWATTQSYLAQNRGVVEKFSAAAAKANTYLSTHPEAIRKIVLNDPTINMTPEQAASMPLPQFTPVDIQKSALQPLVDLMVKFKVIKSPVDLNKAVFTP